MQTSMHRHVGSTGLQSVANEAGHVTTRMMTRIAGPDTMEVLSVIQVNDPSFIVEALLVYQECRFL